MYMCLDSEEAFHAALRSTKFLYVRYGAPWCPQCEALDRALEELQRQFPKVTFAGLDAERLAEVAQRQGVEAVPHAVFYKNGRRFGEVTQIALPAIKSGLRRMIYSEDDPNAPMDQRLTALINRHKVMLFMKGSPQVRPLRLVPLCSPLPRPLRLRGGGGLATQPPPVLAQASPNMAIPSFRTFGAPLEPSVLRFQSNRECGL